MAARAGSAHPGSHAGPPARARPLRDAHAAPRAPRRALGFSAKARDQRLLAVLQLAHVVDVALAHVRFGVQPPKLRTLVVGLVAHDTIARSNEPVRVLLGIVAHRAADVHALIHPAVGADLGGRRAIMSEHAVQAAVGGLPAPTALRRARPARRRELARLARGRRGRTSRRRASGRSRAAATPASGRFFEDFRNWTRIAPYEEVIRGSRLGAVGAG